MVKEANVYDQVAVINNSAQKLKSSSVEGTTFTVALCPPPPPQPPRGEGARGRGREARSRQMVVRLPDGDVILFRLLARGGHNGKWKSLSSNAAGPSFHIITNVYDPLLFSFRPQLFFLLTYNRQDPGSLYFLSRYSCLLSFGHDQPFSEKFVMSWGWTTFGSKASDKPNSR